MEFARILALSGSLREASYNSAAIKAVQILAPENIEVCFYPIGDLPLFNPDLEGKNIPSLDRLLLALRKSDGLIIASPEYAHGVSGPMKNALDWLVSCVDFPGKLIMLINTSPRASYAQESLKEILKTMSGIVVEESNVSIPLLGSDLDVNGILGSEELSNSLMVGLSKLCTEIKRRKHI